MRATLARHSGAVSAPLVQSDPPRGRPADRIAAALAALGLLGSVAGTVWFFAGFLENDGELRAASSAFLLSLGLSAFAIVPCAVVLRLAHTAWRRGFRPSHGWWTLLLMGPWVGLAGLLLARSPLSWPGPIAALALGLLLCAWASISLWLHARERDDL